jgi:outer membrane autotransporter protein
VYAPAVSWSGFYIGGHAGGGFGSNEWTNFQNPLFAPNVVGYDPGSGMLSGFLGGAQVGANYQIHKLVIGIEGEFSWMKLSAHVPCAGNLQCSQDPVVYDTRIDRITTLTGRLGLTAGNALLFVKGGAAWMEERLNVHCTVSGTCLVPVVAFDVNARETRQGWTFGTGVEYAIDRHWSAKLEYDFLDFGNDTVRFPAGNTAGPSVGGFSVDLAQQIHTVKAGLNYRF